jgi:hypothetical protein
MNLTDPEYVKGLKANMIATFDSPQGKLVMEFLERSCGWYESIFDPENRDRVLINAGRREVIATIKTILQQSPEAIVALAQAKEQDNG